MTYYLASEVNVKQRGETSMYEQVFVNTHGDTAQQWRPGSGWRSDYLNYLAARCDAHVMEYLRRIG
jgi:hypothetical protein